MIKQTDMEFISMLTDQNTKANGRMTNSMVSVLNIGVTILNMWGNMQTLRKKAKASTCGQMVTSTLASGDKM